MKEPILEKSTIKWIFTWLVICFVFWIIAFAGFYDNYKVDEPDLELRQIAWNELLQELDALKGQVQREVTNSRIPAGAIMIFTWEHCPSWWRIWTSPGNKEDAFRFLLPLQSEGGVQYDWSGTITLTKENIPAHSHLIIWDVAGNWEIWLNDAVAISNSIQNWYSDYVLVWTTAEATKWKTSEYTSELWEWEPITEYKPKFKRVLFCEKSS